MDQIVNAQERSSSFLKFLIMFLITMIMVILAIFYNYRMPWKENQFLREEVMLSRDVETRQEKFVMLAMETGRLIDTLSDQAVPDKKLQGQVQTNIENLRRLSADQGTQFGKLDQLMTSLMTVNATLVENKAKTERDIGDFRRLESDLQTCRQENLLLRKAAEGESQ